MLCKQKQQHYGIVYFCSNNKQTVVQEDVLLLSFSAGGEARLLPRTSAPIGGGELQSRGNVAACNSQVRDMGRKLAAALSLL